MLISTRTLFKFIVNTSIFLCQSFEVFIKLCNFLGLNLCDMSLLLQSFSEMVNFIPELLDFILSVK